MRFLRLMHEPVGITFLFDEKSVEQFRAENEYCEPVRPLTFCQAELGARMEGRTVLLEMKKLWCLDARCCFGVDEVSDAVVRDLLRFGTDEAQCAVLWRASPAWKKRRWPWSCGLCANRRTCRTSCISAATTCRRIILWATGWPLPACIPSARPCASIPRCAAARRSAAFTVRPI